MRTSAAFLVQSLADSRIVGGKGSKQYRRLAQQAARESLPSGLPAGANKVDGWTAMMLAGDGETVLREWRWLGDYWQEMKIG